METEFSYRTSGWGSSHSPPSLDEIQAISNASLRDAMANERSKRWPRVIESYRRLIKTLSRENLPSDFKPPSWLPMLLYECHYHLGIALQQNGEHSKAVNQYSKAIDAVFIPKNGCLAGCISNSCLMTPLYARRAFAQAMAGDLKNALKDAEKTVVLDSKNPDVFCIRALVRGTRGEEKEALKDIERALKYNPNHLCALIVRGKLAQPTDNDDWMGIAKDKTSPDHIKACLLNPDCHNYLNVQDFNHPDILTFYERFLYSLSIPHTVSEISFPPGTSNKGSRSCSRGTSRSTSRATTPMSTAGRAAGTKSVRFHPIPNLSADRPPFRAGAPSKVEESSPEIAVRRREYAESVREHMSRPRTAEEYIAFIEKQRLKRQIQMMHARPETSSSRGRHMGGSGFSDETSALSDGRKKNKGFAAGKIVQGSHGKKMQVFQKVNIQEAPRMYYRPWLGDKLPVAEIDKKQWANPPFKV